VIASAIPASHVVGSVVHTSCSLEAPGFVKQHFGNRLIVGEPDGSRSPLAFLLPSETTPIVQPYLGMANIQHLAGRQGALAYQHLRSDGMPAEQIAAEISHQRLSMLAYIALFVIGALVVAIYSAATRARSRP